MRNRSGFALFSHVFSRNLLIYLKDLRFFNNLFYELRSYKSLDMLKSKAPQQLEELVLQVKTKLSSGVFATLNPTQTLSSTPGFLSF